MEHLLGRTCGMCDWLATEMFSLSSSPWHCLNKTQSLAQQVCGTRNAKPTTRRWRWTSYVCSQCPKPSNPALVACTPAGRGAPARCAARWPRHRPRLRRLRVHAADGGRGNAEWRARSHRRRGLQPRAPAGVPAHVPGAHHRGEPALRKHGAPRAHASACSGACHAVILAWSSHRRPSGSQPPRCHVHTAHHHQACLRSASLPPGAAKEAGEAPARRHSLLAVIYTILRIVGPPALQPYAPRRSTLWRCT